MEWDILESPSKDPIYDDTLVHYGVKRRSGRYPWGSGENPYQHSGDIASRISELRKSGMSDADIAKSLGFGSSGDLRNAYSVAINERRKLEVERAKSLKEDGLSTSEIARRMGKNESTIRSYLNRNSEANMLAAEKTAEYLKKELKEKHALDIGEGVERELGVSKNKLEEALLRLEIEGYDIYGISVPQPSDPKKRTTIKVVSDGAVTQRDAYQDPSKIKSVGEYHSKDGGFTFDKREYPSSISSKRVQIRYGDEGGSEKDGVIELRRGVKDLDLGNSHYAQVRILVDGTHYLKGMAMYSDDLPDGVDVIFNTNKKSGTPKLGEDGVLKKIKNDPDNPFGAYIKADGQSFYDDPKGKYTDPITGKKQSLSAINKLKEEGDWDTMSRNLSSQFLSKQPMSLINKQLKLTYDDAEAEFDEIMSYTNPTVRRKLLGDFANQCDSATIHLQAAALPRQTSRVILPVTQMKDNEVYAPTFRDGEKVALIRYPHGGTFEIPILTVNNKNPSAKKILGPETKDAIGINSKVAERLSGADFDGDSVVVIPVNSRVRVKSTPSLKGLEDFDPKVEYSTVGKTGVKLMTKAQKGIEMGIVSNLITDMTLRGAPESDIVKAVRHSMVVIDAEKHKLDYKQSEIDNDIPTLKKKWQIRYDADGTPRYGGASTLISRRKQTIEVPERKGSGRIDKETGEVIYKESGRTYTNKQGKTVQAKNRVPLMQATKDIKSLSSGTAQEDAYADYANKMKALANRARKEYAASPLLQRSPAAAKTYAKEVKELEALLDLAARDAPRQRQALALANTVIKAKVQANPELGEKGNQKELNKVKRAAMEEARAKVGADSAGSRIHITDKQWEAIQAGAISDTKLRQILRYSDPDEIKQRALPKATTTLSAAKVSKLNSMRTSGYTIAQIADSLGVSTSTVSKYLNQ